MRLASLRRDETGSVLVEVTVLLPIIMALVFGAVDFLYAFYQWNVASKAVEVGARIAAVSDPVSGGGGSCSNNSGSLDCLSNSVLSSTVRVGSPMPAFTITCNGATASCTCTGTCTGLGSYNATAMNRIVYGRGNGTTCNTKPASYYFAGICTFLPSVANAGGAVVPLTASNVVITYTQTGLGYVGRLEGPVPTISVSLQNVYFKFFFLSYLLGNVMKMPAMMTTITAEDLCSGGGDGYCGS